MPQDVDGECNAILFIADDYGDNHATIRCGLVHEHDGLHCEGFKRAGGMVMVTWAADERIRCDHGCGQWDHAHHEDTTCPKFSDSHESSDCAYCNPDEIASTCSMCDAAYYEVGHKKHCPKEPFTCETCGESGMGPHAWPFGCPRIKTRETANPRSDEASPALDVCIVEIQPHSDQSTTHPGWWKVKFAVSYDVHARTFWRWHKATSEKIPTTDVILAWFWGTVFAELHGFTFDEVVPVEPVGTSVGTS